MKGNQILAALLINSYLPFSFLSLPLLFVLCVRLTKMGSKLSFFFFFLFNVWWSTQGVRYTECQLSIFFLLSLILLTVNKIDQKKQFIELLCLFCFLGWSLSICILLGTHSHFILEHVNVEHSLGTQATWSGLFAFICLFVLQVIQAWRALNSLAQACLLWMKHPRPSTVNV